MTIDSDSPLIVALDYSCAADALTMADQLDPELTRVKVGKELFTAAGPHLIEALHERGFEIFLDLKFHDIPNTVMGAVKAAANLGVWTVNVHASGGRRMMEAAREGVEQSQHKPELIAVTILTSMQQSDLTELDLPGELTERVLGLASLAQSSGMDGVVCSAHEASQIRRQCGDTFSLITPGIRLAGDSAGDQRRVVTPTDAMALGSNYLVMGRSITGSQQPVETVQSILESLDAS